MIPKAQLPFLKPLPDMEKRKKLIKKKGKKPEGKKHRDPKVLSKTQLKAQIKRYTG